MSPPARPSARGADAWRRPRWALAALLAALLGPAPLLAAPGDPLPLGHGYRVRFDERGVWRAEGERGTLLRNCGLRVWTEAGYRAQSDARPASSPGDGATGRTFHGTLRAGRHTVRYWQTATPVAGGLLVRYAVAAPGLDEDDEVAAGFELPVGTFGGGRCSAGGRHVPLPEARSAKPRLLQRPATTLRVERDGLALSFQRRREGKVLVQDGRHWHNPCYQAMAYARRGAGDPQGWRSLEVLVRLGEPAEGPLIAAVAPRETSLPCTEVHQVEVVLWAQYQNPFRDDQVRLWAEVTPPSGEPYSVEGFFARDYQRSREGTLERLQPRGHGRWRLRLAPTRPGKYSYVVRAQTPRGQTAWEPATVMAQEAQGQPFLRPPTRQSRYLETARGQPVLLIGHNYAWPDPDAPTYDADAMLARMAGAGLNAARLWLCSWGIRIEGQRPDAYRLDDAWRLDHVLATARQHGVYVLLCLDNFTDLSAPQKAAHNPYLVRNGGPCRRPEQFFSLPEARAQHRRRLRYLLARFAARSSIAAWELCNELDYATPQRRDPALLDWTRQAAAYLGSRDPHRRPVTASLGPRSTWDELWQLPQLALVQAHTYIHRPVPLRDRTELDAAALALREAERGGAFAKPFLVGEFGFLGTRDHNPLNEADRTGVHLHNALWASALGGCAGTAMSWWWDSYLADRDLYYHYTAIARFFRGQPLPGPEWNAFRAKGEGPVRIVGLKSASAALLWVQHRRNTWYRRVVEERQPPALEGVSINLTGLDPGRYRVEWWDTYAGQVVTHIVRQADRGRILLRVPGRFPDIACKIRRLGP
ncbi:MAG: DUF5060 domain-containing protein [Candidatus Brocadiia bacterium]